MTKALTFLLLTTLTWPAAGAAGNELNGPPAREPTVTTATSAEAISSVEGLIRQGRMSGDPGYFRLALRAAQRLSGTETMAALALRIESLRNLHRFAEAETLGRQLQASSPRAEHHVLLADVLTERGKLADAAAIYQSAMAQKPGALVYGRAARLRYLCGDLPGAVRFNQRAVRATHPEDLEMRGWLLTEGSTYARAAGDHQASLALGQAAVAASRSVHSRWNLVQAYEAASRYDLAVAQLNELVRDYPMPDALAALARLLDHLGRPEEAAPVRSRLHRLGSRIDPRGFAQYLLESGNDPERAAELIDAELKQRRDPQTLRLRAEAHAALGEPALATAARLEADSACPTEREILSLSASADDF